MTEFERTYPNTISRSKGLPIWWPFSIGQAFRGWFPVAMPQGGTASALKASFFSTRNAACCRSASPLYAWLKWSFIPNWPRNYNLVNKFSGVESVSLLRATVRDRVSRGCATVGHHAGHAGTGVPHPHCEACVNAQLRLWPVLLPVPLPHGCGAVLRVSDAGSRFPGYQFRLI